MSGMHTRYWPKPSAGTKLCEAKTQSNKYMNAELVKQALEKILNPHVLVNMVSRRVRELSGGARPLVINTGTLGLADVALLEIIEDKMGFEMPALVELIRPSAQVRKRPQGWKKEHADRNAA
jgi:DNA-directed RNA polymerase subunit omega